MVSVVIPALNEAQTIAGCLRAARRSYPGSDVELVVSDGGSTDGTVECAVAAGARVVSGLCGRARQMNSGAAAARGRILVFCHADTRLPAGWLGAVRRALAPPAVVGGVFQPLFLPSRGALRLLNSVPYPVLWWVMYGDQVQFMHRATFERVGGFPELPLMEDLEMSRRLSREGRLVRLHERALTSSRRFLERGTTGQLLFDMWCVTAYLGLRIPAGNLAWRYEPGRH